ncbi:MAG: AraC family transcriptional regulator [Cyanobacteriota bacterium]|nr:AraC family transcriptional regulator [Cyanobacteriota bacterium]
MQKALEGILYFAPGTALWVTSYSSEGVVTFIPRQSLLNRAIQLSQGRINLGMVAKRLGRSQKLSTTTPASRHLIEGLYSCFTLLDSIYQAGEEPISRTAVDNAFLKILLLLLFPEIRALEAQQQALKPKLMRMKELEDWIIDNLVPRLCMRDLELHSSYSSRSIQGYFQDQHDMSPKQWIIKQRMQKSLNLLNADNRLSIGDTARQCGYLDGSRFSRHFLKTFGFMPKDCNKIQVLTP